MWFLPKNFMREMEFGAAYADISYIAGGEDSKTIGS